MSNVPTTLRGYVAPLPSGQPCRVALVTADNDDGYPVLPRGAGIDLVDLVSVQLEVVCTIRTEGENRLLHVRSYQVIDALEEEEAWYSNA